MPGQQQYPEEESLEAPEKLLEALGQLHKGRIFVPPTVDQAVLQVAGKHLRRLKPPCSRRKSWLPWAAMAACLALVVWLAERFSSPVPVRPFAREDINRDGRVDVLDAFALARRIEGGGTLDRRWDVNGDGRVDRADVNAIVARAVSLAQAGPEPKRSADSRAGDPHAVHRSAGLYSISFLGNSCSLPGFLATRSTSSSPHDAGVGRGPRRGASVIPPLPGPLLHLMEERECLVAGPLRWAVSKSWTQSSVLAGSRLLRLVLRTVSVYRGLGVSERSAAFTPVPLGTPCVALRIFPTAGKGSTVKRPEGRAPGALGWGAKQILRTQPRSVWLRQQGSPAGWWQHACKSEEGQT